MTEGEFYRMLVQRCGVPRKLARLEHEDMEDGGLREYRTALRRVREIGERLPETDFYEEPVFVYLSGSFGSGKTRSAVWLLREAYRGMLERRRRGLWSNREPLFIKAARLVDFRFRQREDDEEDEDAWDVTRRKLFESRFLVIDDVGRLAGYKGEQNFVERVIESRFDAELSTVLTGNAGDGDFAPRFLDFMTHFEEVTLVGPTRSERAG